MIKISSEDIKIAIIQENPWWREFSNLAGAYRDLKKRQFLAELKKLVMRETPNREVILLGPRRVGKTVLIHHLIQSLLEDEGVEASKILYVQIDNPLYFGMSLIQLLDYYREITGCDWRREKSYIFFDEIQYLNDWEVQLKSIHDSGGASRFTATGSAQAALSRGSIESGAGRFTDFILPPLLFKEYLNFKSSEGLVEQDERGLFSIDIEELNRHLLDYINFGGYPEIALSEIGANEATRYMRTDILDKVLLRDLPSLYGIQDVRELNRLFTMLVYNSGHELNLEGLSQSSQVTKNTIKKYLEYLEASFLIRVMYRVDKNVQRFKRDHTFKVYLTNSSIRTGLFASLEIQSEHLGHGVETALIAQRFNQINEYLHYARWKSGKEYQELDLVRMNRGMQLTHATEIKFSDRVVKQTKSWSPWIDFCDKNGLDDLTITTKTIQEKKAVGRVTIHFQPTALYMYEQGEI
jgi:uncharacterized protein